MTLTGCPGVGVIFALTWAFSDVMSSCVAGNAGTSTRPLSPAQQRGNTDSATVIAATTTATKPAFNQSCLVIFPLLFAALLDN
jgi:hypothetical protein